jgi:hypothetical protein
MCKTCIKLRKAAFAAIRTVLPARSDATHDGAEHKERVANAK